MRVLLEEVMLDRTSEFTSRALGISHADDQLASLISHGICGYMRHAMIYAGRKKMDLEQVIESSVGFLDRGVAGSISGRERDRTAINIGS